MANDIERKNPYADDALSQMAPTNVPGTGSDIQRTDPYATSAPQSPTYTLPEITIGQSPTQDIIPPSPTTPLSTQDYIKQQIQSGDIRKIATQDIAETQAKGLETRAQIQAGGAAEQQRSIEESRLAMQQAIADANVRDNNLRKLIQEQSAKQIDPSHWWNSRDTGQKILAGIGMILGGFGAGLAHKGENPAQQIINGAIDRDMQSQRENIAAGWKGIMELHNLDDTAFNRELHRQTWENNFRVAGLEKVKLELASAADKTTSQVTRQNALLGIQELTDAQSKIRNQQYLLGQQAILANINRLRGLNNEADKEVQDLIKIQRVSHEDAMLAVYSRPKYQELQNPHIQAAIGIGAPPSQQDFIQRIQQNPAAVKRFQLMTASGLSAQDAIVQMSKDPAYADLFKNMRPIGVVVPPEYKPPTPEQVLEQRTAAQLKQNLDEIDTYMKDVNTISPSVIEGLSPETRQNIAIKQDQYHSFVLRAVAEMYKAQSGGVEPKNQEQVAALAAPYLPGAVFENTDVTKRRMELLKHDLQASTTGITKQAPTIPNPTIQQQKIIEHPAVEKK